ncbi:hypothetical protein V5799_020259 [Amblyomma americanum]|uniref:Peptidoglycan binding-like domain-containing protein n=1 Tax=Amblyomma americanum TaxID=6943 RepID=A0AAQ4EUK2_AMBAM
MRRRELVAVDACRLLLSTMPLLPALVLLVASSPLFAGAASDSSDMAMARSRSPSSPLRPWRFTLVQLCLEPFLAQLKCRRQARQNYLEKFGYIAPTKNGTAALRSQEALVDAVKEFQRFAGLRVTGELPPP